MIDPQAAEKLADECARVAEHRLPLGEINVAWWERLESALRSLLQENAELKARQARQNQLAQLHAEASTRLTQRDRTIEQLRAVLIDICLAAYSTNDGVSERGALQSVQLRVAAVLDPEGKEP